MMTGRSPSINSKFKLTYQFLLKILNNSDHDLDKFLGKSLFSQDNQNQIEIYKNDMSKIQQTNTLSINNEDLLKIKEFHKKKFYAENLRGNAKRKEFLKLDNFKKEIKNFHQLNSKYEKYISQNEDLKKIKKNIEYLKGYVNEDVDKMIQYLKDNNYIDRDTSQVLVKGIMASEISECNEILLTEIITNNFFLELEPAQIVAVLSVFIEEKSNEVTEIKSLDVPQNMKDILEQINFISRDFADYEYNSYLEIGTDWNLYLSFVEPAYYWAQGKSIFEIYKSFGNIYEGTFIRNILRIKNIIDNLKNISEMINNPELLKKLENLDSILVRDQVTTESLYIMKS